MKQAAPQDTDKAPQLVPTHFGLNVIVVDEENVKTPIALLKPVQNFTNLLVRPKDVNKPVSFSVVNQALNIFEFSELRSLGFRSCELIDCEDNVALRTFEATIDSLPCLKTVSLSRVFCSPNSNLSAQGVLTALGRKKSLEELLLHDNNLQNWNQHTWAAVQQAVGSIKRLSFKSSEKMSADNFNALSDQLVHAKQLVSCEIKIQDITTAQLKQLSTCFKASEIRVLELGTFDLTNVEHLDIIKNILKTFPALKTLGLKVERWDPQIAGTVFKMIAQHGQQLNQLIIDSTDVEYKLFKMREDLAKTQLLDIRFVNALKDCTTESVNELALDRINSVYYKIKEKKGKVEGKELVRELRVLISRLNFDKSSVSFLTHQIVCIINNYLSATSFDESVHEELKEFLAQLSRMIDEGKMPCEFFVYVFFQNIFPPHVTLPLYPAVMRACQSAEEIEECLRPYFMSVVAKKIQLFQKMIAIQEKFVGMEASQLEKSLVELNEVAALLGEPLYFPLLRPVERYGYLLAINSLKDEFSEKLGRDRDQVQTFVKSHCQEFLQSTDLQQFRMFITCNVPILARLAIKDESRAMKLFQFLLSGIKSADFLFEASNIITHLKSHTPTIPEQLFLLKFSLACQRVAIFRGFDDKEKCFETGFKEFQKTIRKNATECLSEIDNLVVELFNENVAHSIPIFLKEQIEAERAAVPQRVSLSHLLRAKPEDQDPKKPVSLKAYLRPQGVPLTKFFDDQKKDDEPDLHGARVNDGLL